MKNPFRQTNDPQIEAELRETRPFFWILILVLCFLYVISIYNSPELRQPARLIPYTFLMALHIALHWYVPYLITRASHLILYLIVQIALIFALTLISQQQAVAIGLFLALAGETMGILEDWRRGLLAMLGFLTLIGLTIIFIWGWAAAAGWMISAVVMLLFTLVYVVLYLRQLHARSDAQDLLQELQMAHGQLAEYSQQVESLTREAERQRMARELHDTLAQGLAGLVLQLEALEAYLEKGNRDQAVHIAAQAKERARSTLADARRAIDDLRVTGTTPLEAISQEAARFSTATGIPCHLELPPTLALPPATADHVVRCVSEGLANVARHAQATQVWVTVSQANGRLQVEIRDDGQGFDAANGQIPAGHYGLLGLRERARLAGGQLTVESEPNAGATLQMQIPLAAVEELTA